MLFIFHWIFYAMFYIIGRAKGHCHYIAYRYNPFELEAFSNDPDANYLRKRKPFAWVKYISSYATAMEQDLLATVPKEKLIKWRF
jgi:hypothetical protein